jgi:preprotein translocase subunit SecA
MGLNYKNIIYSIKAQTFNISIKTDEELRIQIEILKKRVKNESLNKIIPEWFALVQEISWREIGLKHYETQLLAGLLLHEGKIIEMKTGEGKTLSSTLSVSLNALTQKGVHVVTVNDYLAERDQRWMGKIYKRLGLNVGLITSNQLLEEKKKNYNKNITYVTNSELVFDYLRDNSAYSEKEAVQRELNYCILDEIDSILIDEARTPLILSTVKGTTDINKLQIAKNIVEILKKSIDFYILEKTGNTFLTEIGYEKVATYLGLEKKSLHNWSDPWILPIINALKAKYLLRLNKDYIILNDQIMIVDEFTGRIAKNRRWSSGIHEAIEIKEKVTVGAATQTKTSITYQNFFSLYDKLSGMTGTAKTSEKEFKDIYNLQVEVIPTKKQLIRKDFSDLVYQTDSVKWNAILKQSLDCYRKGQPILIGTSNVEKSESLSERFSSLNIPHQVLNAKPENVFKENEIIALAGEKSTITIATNMAGRGTDIILGGNPSFKVKKKMMQIFFEDNKDLYQCDNFVIKVFNEYSENNLKLAKDICNLPYSLEQTYPSFQIYYKNLYNTIYKQWKIDNKFVRNIGGLFVLGTERSETRRIDNQLRGRSGRQGDPGISKFFVSLEDDLFKKFAGDNIKEWINSFLPNKNVPLKSVLLSRSLENAQKKIELYNYDLRKSLFEYDNILNKHRKSFFITRKIFLTNYIYNELLLYYTETNLFAIYTGENKKLRELIDERKVLKLQEYNIPINQKYREKDIKFKTLWIDKNKKTMRLFQTSFDELSLRVIDAAWSEHIERTNYIRDTIEFRSYGQENPLIVYNLGAIKSYKKVFSEIRRMLIMFFILEEKKRYL